MATYVYKVNESNSRPKRTSFFSSLSVTTFLVAINVILFLVFSVLLFTEVLSIDDVALSPANVFAGKYLWTFVTSMFMHGGAIHLFVNMFSLFFMGSLVERLLGRKRYLWLYLGTGLAASVFFVFIAYGMAQLGYPDDFTVYAVGASGALFGVIGFLMLITPNLPVMIMFIPIPIKMKYAAPGILIVLWLISWAPVAVGGEQIRIGNTAHLGGLLAGVLYGLYVRKKYPRKAQAISRYFS